MSRLTESEAKGLMDAYNAVYASQEEVVEEIEQLDEAPMTAFQAGGGQAKLDQLNKGRSPRAGRVTAAQIERQGQQNLYKAGGGDAAIAKGPTRAQNVRGGGQVKVPTLTRQDIINRGAAAAGSKPKPAAPATPVQQRPAAPVQQRPAAPVQQRPAAPVQQKPSTSTADTKTSPAPTPTKTPNPLLKDGSIQRMQQASQIRQKGANVTSDMISDKSVKVPTPVPQMSARAQALKAGGPAGSVRERMLNQDVDMFDIVKGHLMSEGYADNEEAALAIMANMSEEWKQSIVEMNLSSPLFNRPSNRIDGKPSASKPSSDTRPVAKPGMTPMQRLQSRPDTTIR